jgi:hypothetical protein
MVVADVRQELGRFRSLRDVFADVVSDELGAILGVPIVAVFRENAEASLAQREVAGRRYRGRVVITMLEKSQRGRKGK